jgi:hypothetical protein
MKKILMVSTLMACGSLNALAQGSVIFSNAGGQPVVCADGFNTRIPVGSAYQAELMYAPDGTSGAEFDSMAIRIGAPANFGPTAGFFSGGGRTVNSLQPAGGFGLFQVRVWTPAYGASYNEVLASGNPGAGAGKSSIIRVDTANPLIGEPDVSLVAAGLTGFLVFGGPACVPEPSTVALGILTGAALLVALRRKPIS